MRLLFQIGVLLLTLQRGTSTDSCLREDWGKIRLTGPRSIKNEGAVQLCLRTNRNEYLWFYIATQDGWTNNRTATNLACRELGMSYTDVTVGTVQLMEDAVTVTVEINCNNEAEKFIDCLPSLIDISGRNQVAGLICNCIEGALRMVDGSSYNEGRVEVCSNGRWGTVCGDGWTEREAALVCSRLGYPTLNATISNFGEGSGPLYDITCRNTESDDHECTPIITSAPSRCSHSMDVGVRCLPFIDVCPVPVNEIIVTVTAYDCQQLPTPTPTPTSTIAKCTPMSTVSEQGSNVNEMTTNDRQSMIVTETPQPNNGATTDSSIKNTSGTLGALIGLLAAALVVVVAGWIVSCVYFQQKINKHHTHSTSVSTNNPTLQHTPQDEGNQTLYDTINDTATNLEHKEDTVQCVQNESYSLVGQRKTDTLNV
ncbi:deleted in malignant brain tumors 1 protein-like isoform X2 [Halichondria panicea]|uniref:deleted in malignant brain tumors 1 protein-like isoform X2 n=1 Tax=Halichondria panicea TaxID=6063 RepID=UPI00312B8C10